MTESSNVWVYTKHKTLVKTILVLVLVLLLLLLLYYTLDRMVLFIMLRHIVHNVIRCLGHYVQPLLMLLLVEKQKQKQSTMDETTWELCLMSKTGDYIPG